MPLLPSRPSTLKPQAARVPSEHKTKEWLLATATATTVLPDSTPLRSTKTGTELFTVLLLPNSPLLPKPQAARVPSEHKATL